MYESEESLDSYCLVSLQGYVVRGLYVLLMWYACATGALAVLVP